MNHLPCSGLPHDANIFHTLHGKSACLQVPRILDTLCRELKPSKTSKIIDENEILYALRREFREGSH